MCLRIFILFVFDFRHRWQPLRSFAPRTSPVKIFAQFDLPNIFLQIGRIKHREIGNGRSRDGQAAATTTTAAATIEEKEEASS